MKQHRSKLILAVFVGLWILSFFPELVFSQPPVITGLGIQNLLYVSIDVIVKFDDNTTETKTISDHDQVLFSAPNGKHIVQLMAGGRTLDIPMDPTIQIGWNFPSSCCAETIKAVQHGIPANQWDSFWPVEYAASAQLGIQFSY